MTPEAMVFMALSWTAVLSLTGWAFYRLLGSSKRRPPTDGDPHR